MGKWQYPKWKRMAVQAVLCLVFATSLALAQWVVHDRQMNGITRLGAVEVFGRIGIRRPEGWSLKSPSIHATVRVTLEEPTSSERSGRELTITAEKVTPGTSVETELGPGRLAGSDLEPIKIGPVTGIMVIRRTFEDIQIWLSSDLKESEYQLIACGVDANGLAITIALKCPFPTDADGEMQKEYLQENKILMRDIARAIVVQPKL